MDDYIVSRIRQAEADLKAGNLTSAHFALKKVLRRDPANVPALVLSCETRLQNDDRTAAEDIVNHLFDLRPDLFDPELQARLGHICFDTEQPALAIRLFQWAAKKLTLKAGDLYRLGVCQRQVGKLEDAEKSLLGSTRLSPDSSAAWMQLGHIYKAQGRAHRAARFYKSSIERSPSAPGMGYWALADLKSYDFTEAETAEMKRTLRAGLDDDNQTAGLCHALGWAAEKAGDFASAIDYYHRGNALKAKITPFARQRFRKIVDDLRTVPGAEQASPSGRSPVPILIVGLPRSGTTLVEQILSAHSRVRATDELPFLEKMALRLEMNGGYPARLKAMNEQEKQLLGEQYLRGANTYLAGRCDFFIDKYPGNFLHIGLARRIAPDAVIIDVRRDPRDVAISTYRQLFLARNEFSSSFDDIGVYYRGYLDLIRHWQSVYPGQVLTLHYERLARDPEAAIRELLDFCRLEFESECLEFHRQKRAVMTPSVSQVTQPMYTTSIGQWRNFEPYVPKAMAQLGALTDTGQDDQ